MVKKVHLQAYLTSSQLKNRYLCVSDRVESRRWHLLWLVSQQWTIQQASVAVGLNYDYAKDLVKAYNRLIRKLGKPPLSGIAAVCASASANASIRVRGDYC